MCIYIYIQLVRLPGEWPAVYHVGAVVDAVQAKMDAAGGAGPQSLLSRQSNATRLVSAPKLTDLYRAASMLTYE